MMRRILLMLDVDETLGRIACGGSRGCLRGGESDHRMQAGLTGFSQSDCFLELEEGKRPRGILAVRRGERNQRS